MSYINHEFEVVKKTSTPNTLQSLKRDLDVLGIKKGLIVIMHSSLSQIGWTVGGPVAVIRAMMDLLTPKGTLVMPTFTGDNSEPSKWENPPVPKDWWDTIRTHIPAYDPIISPTRGMGKIVEVFRKFPKVFRSNHPISSFAAWGKYAKQIIRNHDLNSDLGEKSPLARIYELDGQILLLGVSHENNSSLHLAEYRAKYPGKRYRATASAVIINKKRKWVIWDELNHNINDFEKIGQDFERAIKYKPKKVGFAQSRLLPQRQMINFAIKWMDKNRKNQE